MQFPDQLTLPQNVKTALLKHLTEPFQSESAAKAYWQQNDIQLVISKVPDDVVPEYTDTLIDNFDEFLVVPGFRQTLAVGMTTVAALVIG